MPAETLKIRTVLCVANLPDGHTISLAELCDGRFGIYLDAEVASAQIFDSAKLNSSINAYLARKWELQHPELRAPTSGASLGWVVSSLAILSTSALTGAFDGLADWAALYAAT